MRGRSIYILVLALVVALTAGASAATSSAPGMSFAPLTESESGSDPLDPPGFSCDNPSGYSGFTGACPVLHPGDAVFMPGFRCTLNFLWRGSDGQRYMGTAGHCAFQTELGGRVQSGTGQLIGRLAYKAWDQGRTPYNDFALVRLHHSVKTSPQMLHWGGPTARYTAMTEARQTMWMFGQATGVSYVAPARELLATAVTRPDIIHFAGAASFNDSGAPVVTEDGQAAGWIVTLAEDDAPASTSASGGVEAGVSHLIRIEPMVRLAEKALGIRLTLQTAPLR